MLLSVTNYHCYGNAFLVSSLIFLAPKIGGRVTLFPTGETPAPSSDNADIEAFVLRAVEFAAATARKRFPLLCLFPILPDRPVARLRKGLGRFSSSVKSYSLVTSVVAGAEFVRCIDRPEAAVRAVGIEGTEFTWLWRCGWGRGRGLSCDGPVIEPARLLGSDMDKIMEPETLDLEVADDRIDGRRIRVGGGIEMIEVDADDGRLEGDTLRSLLAALPYLRGFSLRRLGLGGGDSASSVLSSVSTAAFLQSGSKILVKSRPTFGESTKSFARSLGAGVASTSPVEVSTTPFIADAGVAWTSRVVGVKISGKEITGWRLVWDCGVDSSAVVPFSRQGELSLVSGSSKFLTSSKGVFSLRPK